jgi:hypothetical protein
MVRAWVGTLLVVLGALSHCGGQESDACASGEKKCFIAGKMQCVALQAKYGCSDPSTSCVSCYSLSGLDCRDVDQNACNAQGQCYSLDCQPGYRNCDHLCANQCETYVDSDVEHCGACDTRCGPVANGSPACFHGICVVECSSGFADCDRVSANGCEVDLRVDPNHCGQCDKTCPAGSTCAAGTCG